MTKKATKKTRGLGAKDLVIAYLSDGETGVIQMLRGGEISESAARRGAALLSDESDRLRVVALIDHVIGPKRTARGRPAPVLGEARRYRARQVADGAVFIRLPLETLGVTKGGRVTAIFSDGQIKVVANG